MKMAGTLLFLLLAGPCLLALGILSLRRGDWRESVPLAEIVIDRAVGIEPPPRTHWDQRFSRVHPWMAVVFGSFFTLCLVAVIFTLVSE